MSEISKLNGYDIKDKKAIRTYDTVALMKADTTIKEGQHVKTKGYYLANDGGHAEYVIKSNSNSYYETLNNELVAELITDNIIDVKKFGAYCDGIHDDSDALENSFNYVNTLTSSNGTAKRTIIIPSKLKVTRRIDCEADQLKIMGTSLNNSRIVFTGADSYLNIGKSNNEKSFEIEIENIKLYGDYSQTNSILKMTKCTNCYLTRVETCCGGENQYNISFIDCGLIFMDQCTVVGSNDVENYPGNRNGIYINQMGSIFNFTNANCWNLNNLFKFDGNVQNVNIQNNWIECIKSLIEFNCVTDMRYMNIKVENNTINTHAQSEAFYPTTFNFIKLDMLSNTNLFNSVFSINKNTIYLWDVTSINGNSLVYLTQKGETSAWDINYNSNIYSGKTLANLSAYVFYNSDTSFYNKYNVHFKSITTSISSEASRITDDKRIINCIITEGQRGQVTSPNGIYLGSSGTENYGNIYYENGEFLGGYEGTIRYIPKKVEVNIPHATDTTDVITVVNTIIDTLYQAHITNIHS